MTYSYLFYATWLLIGLDIGIKWKITDKNHGEPNKFLPLMFVITVFFAPLLFIATLIIQSFTMFKTEEKA